jgi:hypothetical protein
MSVCSVGQRMRRNRNRGTGDISKCRKCVWTINGSGTGGGGGGGDAHGTAVTVAGRGAEQVDTGIGSTPPDVS